MPCCTVHECYNNNHISLLIVPTHTKVGYSVTCVNSVSMSSFSVCIGVVVQEEQETSYTILRARGCNVTLNGLKPNTAYLLQIRARTAAGYGASSPTIQFETSPDCKSSTRWLVLLSLPQQSSQHLSVCLTSCMYCDMSWISLLSLAFQQPSPSPVRTARLFWSPYPLPWPSSSWRCCCTSWSAGLSTSQSSKLLLTVYTISLSLCLFLIAKNCPSPPPRKILP